MKCDTMNGSNWAAATKKHPDQQKQVVKQQNIPSATKASQPRPMDMKASGVPRNYVGGQRCNPMAVSSNNVGTVESAKSLLEQHRNLAIKRKNRIGATNPHLSVRGFPDSFPNT